MSSIISIIIPCYNQGKYLDEALKSVLEQTFAHWECIIVNDGSSDDTERIAEEWTERDKRFKYVYKQNGGLSSARNAGLDIAIGDYIQFLDSDDYITTTKFEKSLQELNLSKNTDKKVAVSNFRMFVDNVDVSSGPFCKLSADLINFENLLYNWEDWFSIPIHCALFRSSLFSEFRFPEDLKSKEDWVMWVSIFHKDCKAVFIDEPLALYRTNPQSMTKTKDMLLDFIKAYQYFNIFLTEEEYHNFSVSLISRYYKKSNVLKFRLKTTKESYTYQTGLLIKKGLKNLGLLPLSRIFFSFILKLKSK